MENQKNSKGIIVTLIVIIVILLVLVILMATNNNISNDEFTINADKLNEFGKSSYNIIKEVYNTDYSFKLGVDGKININFENNISNISNAKDIILFSPPFPNSILYVLTTNGDIYEYETSNYESGNYNATKIEKYSNIKQMITYKTRKANAGGNDYIILIDNNENYYELNSFSV